MCLLSDKFDVIQSECISLPPLPLAPTPATTPATIPYL